MNILDDIVAYKKRQLEKTKLDVPFLELVKALDKECPLPKFKAKIEKQGIHLIAEIKKASPSAGLIKKDFNVKKIACAYEIGGASCLSVLTEDKFFKGSLSDFDTAVASVKIPVLRKDFIISEYQVYESKVHKADAILLIAAILKQNELKDLFKTAQDIKLDVLAEVHNIDELKMVLDAGARIIGINTRDLKDFSIDFDILPDLLSRIPKDRLSVCESGIKSLKDLENIKKLNVNAVLVGESLMRQQDIAVATKDFVSSLKLS